MKRKLKMWLERHASRFSLYRLAKGGYAYHRVLQENVYKAEEFAHFGRNVRFESGVAVLAPERLYVGDNVGISQRCLIQAVGGCHIGSGCQIGAESIILTVEHQYSGMESLPYDATRLVKPVFIEDYVWLGVRVLVAPGVRIGEGAIVGLGSVVTQDVPALAIVAGNPAQVLRYRGRAEFDRLKERGACIDPYVELPLLKVPPVTKRKYAKELKDLGFDISGGQEYFHYDKFRELDSRLRPVQNGPTTP